MALSVEKIILAANNETTFNKGLSYYFGDSIIEYESDASESREDISAVVQGERAYNVTVVTEDDELSSAFCTCPAYGKWGQACKHIVAVLLKQHYDTRLASKGESSEDKENPSDESNILYYSDYATSPDRSGRQSAEPDGQSRDSRSDTDRTDKKEKSVTAPGGKTVKKAATDGVARIMMNKYAQRENADIIGQSFSDTEKVTLTPTIRQNRYEDGAFIELKIGINRHYIVRDIFELVENVKSLNKVSYGKRLEFIHSMESFDSNSKKLMQIIVEKSDEARQLMRSLGSAGRFEARINKRHLRLSPYALDRIMSLYVNEDISAVFESGAEGSFTVVAENPVLDVSVENSGEGALIFKTERFGIISGEKHIYVQRGRYIHICDEDMSERARDFLKALERCSYKMRIAGRDLSVFCSNVFPTIRSCFRFSGNLDTLQEYMPLPLETDIYIDAPEHNTITARMIYRYGDEEIDYYALHFAGKTPNIARRDLRNETVVRVIISKYFHLYDTNRKVLLLEADDEQMYQFIFEGIPALMEVATVHVSDRLQGYGIANAPKITMGVRLESDLLELDIDPGEFPLDELQDVLSAYREKRSYYRLSDGRYLRLEDNSLNVLAQIADGLELTDKQLQTGNIKVPRYRALYLDRILSENEEIRANRDKYFKDLVRNIRGVKDSDLVVPDELSGILRNYQKTGYRWLKTLTRYNLGGILADDMGLGKTLQVIALFLSAKNEGAEKPSLVVTPASLVLNWESEIRRFAPSLKVGTIIGDNATRKKMIENLECNDIVITSYDMLKRDIEHYEGHEFLYQVIDEAQYIKNHSTQNAKSVKAIKSDYRLALTGTPIENRLSELWSTFDYLMPGYLYSYQKFKRRFETPIVKNGDAYAVEMLKRMTDPFILRRLKSEVLSELPPKTETLVQTSMEGEQRKLYVANALKLKNQILEQGEEDIARHRFHILAMLTRLRQICCDPSLCYADYDGPSAKLETCMELVRESAEGGHKMLLFSQFTSMLSKIEDRLRQEGISYYVMKGDTPKEKRAHLVERFNNDKTQVFLISLKAGGTGLNLIGADVVVHYDPWWNVAAQDQATDRAHRIGQKRNVQVYKLAVKESIEEKILKLQQSKKELADAIISEQGSGTSLITMTKEDLIELLS